MLRLFQVPFLFLAFVVICQAQTQNEQESLILVKSWATGNAIRENVFHFTLDSSKSNRFEYYIESYGYQRYKLSFRFGKADKRASWDRDKWQVVLQEVLSKPNAKREKLGCNLLLVSGCGEGGHYFPKEDNAAILFPTEEPKSPFERIPLKMYYPIALQRTFWVRTFLVTLGVTAFKMNEKDPTKLDSLDLSVSFKNTLTDYK